jgi:glutathione S-transferase
MTTELLGLPYSPWSEKARFALDARKVPYRSRLYQPLLGEPALRVKLRKLLGNVTVPVLTTDDGRVLADSADIARWADTRGEGPKLFPPEHEAEIARFIALSERGLSAGRALSLQRVLADDDALGELVPKGMRRVLGSFAKRVSAAGIRRTFRKYGAQVSSVEAHRRTLTAVLDEIRARLAASPSTGSPRTLLGSFTFADVAMTQVLAFVVPPATGLKIKTANRRCFTDDALRAQYADLVEWRDAIYRTYRSPALS